MKVQPFAVTSVLILLTAAPAANSQELQSPDVASQSSGQQAMDPSNQAMPMDHGGTRDYGVQSGGRNGYGQSRDGQPCVTGLSCDIYQGS